MQQFQPLWRDLHAQIGHARHVAARSVQASDEAEPDRIGPNFEYNRNGRGRRLGRERRRSSARSNNSHMTFNQIRRHRGQPINLLLRPAVFDRNVLAHDIAGFL